MKEQMNGLKQGAGAGEEGTKILMAVRTSYIIDEAQHKMKMKIHGSLLVNY